MKTICAIILLLSLTLAGPRALVAQDGGVVSKLELTAATAAEFDRQREEYFNALEFCSGYIFRQTVMASEEDAREKPLDDDSEVYSGFFAKSGKNYRLTEQYPKNGSTATGVSYDMVGNDQCIAIFYPKRTALDASAGVLMPLVRDEPPIGDVNASNSTIGLVFKSFNASPQEGGEPIASTPIVTPVDGERVKLTYNGTHPVRGKFVKTIIVRVLSKKKSLVEEITFRFFDAQDQTTAVATQLVAEWTDVRGTQIPARVRMILNIAEPARKAKWHVSEWDCGALAKRSPNAEDFIVDIKTGREPKVKIHNPEEGVVDLNAVTPEDWRQGPVFFRNGLRASR